MKKYLFILFLLCLTTSPALAAYENFSLTSSAFKDGQEIPNEYSCHGADINPPLRIRNSPHRTKSFVLIVYDKDSAVGDFAHWAVYNINPKTKRIDKYSIPGNELINDFNQFAYKGPCPMDGGIHQYVFDLYALDTTFEVNENGSPRGLLQMIVGHVIAHAELKGTYK